MFTREILRAGLQFRMAWVKYCSPSRCEKQTPSQCPQGWNRILPPPALLPRLLTAPRAPWATVWPVDSPPPAFLGDWTLQILYMIFVGFRSKLQQDAFPLPPRGSRLSDISGFTYTHSETLFKLLSVCRVGAPVLLLFSLSECRAATKEGKAFWCPASNGAHGAHHYSWSS